jgi:accessory gene regulator B
LITVGLGIIFKCLKAALLYFGIFVLLRSICGGYHAKTYRQCNLIFLTITVIVLSIFKFIPLEQFNGLHICSIAISILTTVYYAPVENENKPLSTRQKKFFRIFGTALVVLLALISCLLKIKISSSYSIIIDTTLLVVAISMFVTEPRRG